MKDNIVIVAFVATVTGLFWLLAWLGGCSLSIHFDKHYHGEVGEQIESGTPDDLERDERWDSLKR